MISITPNDGPVKKNLPGFSRLTDSEIAAAFGRLPDDALQPLELDDLDVDLPADSTAEDVPSQSTSPPPATASVNISTTPSTTEAFANISSDALIDETQLAAMCGCTRRTIRRWIAANQLPPPIRQGRRRIWLAGRIVDWLHARAAATEEQAAREHQALLDQADRYTPGGLHP